MYYILAFILIEAVLLATNVSWDHYLIGWDNIMPEFNILLNLKRAIFGVWLEYRGLGLLDSLSHASTLTHTIIIGFLSVFLPQWLVRYVFIHLAHLVGGIGLFFLAKQLTNHKKAAFAGALFYMLNLGIIQLYNAPLEDFAIHFAALPAVALCISKTLRNPSRKNLLLLFGISLLVSPQAFVPTVFLIFLMLVGILLFFYLRETGSLKRVLLIAFVIFAANAFWILPYGYSAAKNAGTIAHARINEFSSEEIFYRNKARGDLESILTMSGFMLDSIELDAKENQQVRFMDMWRAHASGIVYWLINLVIVGIGLFGLIQALRTKKKTLYPYVASFLVAVFFLANNTIIFEQLNGLIRTILPIIGEAFRFPFTKFITLYTFSLALFISFGLSILFEKFKKYQTKGFVGLLLGLLFLCYPAFTGNFTSPLLRREIPKEYSQLFSYLAGIDEQKRIAVLPAYTFWNWQYRSWGQFGSGFLWYGIPQPTMERAFDPWSSVNEQFYNELSYTVNTSDQTLFGNVLAKYDIAYILLDTHLVNSISQKPINYESLEAFLSTNPALTKKESFDKLSLYEVLSPPARLYQLETTVKADKNFTNENFDSLYGYGDNYTFDKDNPDIVPLLPSLFTEKLQEDLEFSIEETDTTITFIPKKQQIHAQANYTLELPSLFANEFLVPVSIDYTNGLIKLTPLTPRVLINGTEIAIPSTPITLKPHIVTNPASVIFVDSKDGITLSSDKATSYLLNPYVNTVKITDGKNEEVFLVDTNSMNKEPFRIEINLEDDNNFAIIIDKITSPFSSTNVIKNHAYHIVDGKIKTKEDTNGVTLEAKGDDTSEIVFSNNNLFHQASYFLAVKAKYQKGLPINFYVDNPLEGRSEIETRLSKKKDENIFVIPKTEEYFTGYGFHFIVKSVGSELAKSTIEEINLYPFPSTTLKQIKLVSQYFQTKESSPKTPVVFTKLNPTLYEVSLLDTNGYIVLSQAFDSGWKAYVMQNSESRIQNFFNLAFPFSFGKEVDNHVLVNNWANGWSIEPTTNYQLPTTIVIVYLPQYLEYLGFGIVGITLLWVLLRRVRS